MEIIDRDFRTEDNLMGVCLKELSFLDMMKLRMK